MENLIIKAAKNTPEIQFLATGELKISGRFITEDAVRTFQPLINWVKGYEGRSLRFYIKLDYINTSSTMLLFNLLRLIDDDTNISDATVHWYYDEDDEDHLDTGKFYEDRLDKIQFEFSTMKYVA